MARRPGRPTKLEPERKERILQALKAGNYRQVACEYAGVSYGTFSKWMAQGVRRPATEYGEFRKAVLEAERQAEVTCVARVMKATETDWKAAGWWLERKRSSRWARKEKLEHSGPGGGAIPVKAKILHELSDESLDKIETILRTAAAGAASKGAPAAEEPGPEGGEAQARPEPDSDPV